MRSRIKDLRQTSPNSSRVLLASSPLTYLSPTVAALRITRSSSFTSATPHTPAMSPLTFLILAFALVCSVLASPINLEKRITHSGRVSVLRPCRSSSLPC